MSDVAQLNIDFNGLTNMLEEVQKTTSDIETLSGAVGTLEGDFSSLMSALSDINSLEDLRDVLKDMPRLLGSMATQTLAVISSFEALKNLKISQYIGVKLQNAFKGLQNTFIGLQNTFPGFENALGRLGNSFDTARLAVNKKITSLGGLKAAFVKIGLPIIAVTALIAALVLGIRYLWNNNEGFRNFVIGAWEQIRGVFSTVIGFVTGLFTDFGVTISNLGEGFRNFFSTIDPTKAFDIFKRLIPSIIAILIGGLPGLLIKGVSMISNIAAGMGMTVPELLDKVVDMVTGVITKITEKLPDILETGVEILVSLIDGVVSMIPMLLETAITLINSFVNLIIENLPIILDAGINILMSLIDGIVSIIPALLETAITLIHSFVNLIIDNLSIIIDTGMSILMSLIDGITSVLPMLISTAINLIMSIISTLVTNLPQILAAGVQIMKALIDGIISILPQLIQTAISLIVEIGRTLIENLPQIISAGVQVLQALVSGIWSIVATLASLAWDLITRFVSSIGERLSNITTAGREILTTLAEAIVSRISNIASRAREIVTRFVDTIKERMSRITQVGRDIVQGLINGITGMIGNAVDAIGNLASSMMGGITSFFGINSPSRLMRDKVGKALVDGISTGICDNMNTATKSITVLGKEIRDCALDVAEDVGSIIPDGLASGLDNFTAKNKLRPNLTPAYAGLDSVGALNANQTTNNYAGLFEGANIHWHNKADIRETMEEIAWATQRESARMW